MWCTKDGAHIMRELPCTAKAGDLLYWVPDMAERARLILTSDSESVTYTVESGDDAADIRIVFEK